MSAVRDEPLLLGDDFPQRSRSNGKVVALVALIALGAAGALMWHAYATNTNVQAQELYADPWDQYKPVENNGYDADYDPSLDNVDVPWQQEGEVKQFPNGCSFCFG
eukprot:gnl/TRDRNA2_/TRDRNA2_84046_c0_seq1.p2 gnl/TRDRNA2_/TRDRNA2_84046_c0~~gnl/TRDRNA2_/TRDRNA2_84046_c0_seq1.p2  ORF type:complete len:106 (-),score=20.79 gnl/TRDRNA2_/TRDRNA2_84046_c0_seq1:124-441(-)